MLMNFTVANPGSSDLPAPQALLGNVAAILHSIEVDQARCAVGSLDGGFEICAGNGHTEHSAAGRNEFASRHSCSRVEDGGQKGLGRCNTVDPIACSRLLW